MKEIRMDYSEYKRLEAMAARAKTIIKEANQICEENNRKIQESNGVHLTIGPPPMASLFDGSPDDFVAADLRRYTLKFSHESEALKRIEEEIDCMRRGHHAGMEIIRDRERKIKKLSLIGFIKLKWFGGEL